MKTKGLIAVLLISMLLVQQVEPWGIRLRRVGRFIRRIVKPIVCRLACPRVCRYSPRLGRRICRFACRRVCGKGKREAIEGHITPIPNYFDYYDLNDDTWISPEEFADTMGQPVMEGDLMIAFNTTDIDGDGSLTKNEFLMSTVFEFGHDDPLFQDDQE